MRYIIYNKWENNMWSQIEHTEMGAQAWKRLHAARDRGLRYHNADHVTAMYEYLENVAEPYDPILDWAVLYHDIIYDDKPKKEMRSAQQFMLDNDKYTVMSESDAYRVVNMIMATAHHLTYEPELAAIIRADLHHLTSPEHTMTAYVDILRESQQLYCITACEFANENIEFMLKLSHAVQVVKQTDDPKYAKFYDRVLRGRRS